MSELVVREFFIPLDKDELLEAREDRYYVEDIVPVAALVQVLDATRPALNKDGAKFILQHFDTFFSVMVHGNKVHYPLTVRAFDRILKATNLLINEMETLLDEGREVSVQDRPLYLCLNKMYAYLLSSVACYIEDYIDKNSSDKDNIGRKKKGSKKSDAEEEWEIGKQKALETIYRWFQLPLQKLWTPPIVEDSFITVLTQFCYKVLERNKDVKHKSIRETIFEILGTLVKRYNHGITCVVRIIQLVKLYDSLAAPLAAGVVHMVTKTGCVGFIKEMIREIDQNEPGESDARNISIFLDAVANTKPDLILPALDNITEYLSNECYAMRICALGVIGAVLQHLGVLSANNELDEEKQAKREECLQYLEDHLHDVNAYVRSKSLQIWQRLCCLVVVPAQRLGSLLEAASMRLEDKSANVRKQALQLLRSSLENNPFAYKLDPRRISEELDVRVAKLKELKVSVASLSTRGDTDRMELWNDLLPEIRKAINEVISVDTDENDSSDDEREEPEEPIEIDTNVAFEKVRQLLLDEEVLNAVTYLKKICGNIPGAPDMSKMSPEAKEECFFLFLLKIFVECEGQHRNNNDDNNTEVERTTSTTESEDSTRSKELKRLKEELKRERKDVKSYKYGLTFAQRMENSIPMVEHLLFSTTPGDAVESCSFLGVACKFDIPKALGGVQKALYQVLNRDESVRNNVTRVYKEIYLENSDTKQSSRQKALDSVNGLIELFKGLKPGQSRALAQLIVAWRKNKELGDQEIQVMWEKFSMKIPGTRPEDSRAALVLLTLAAKTEPSLLTHGNFDVLIKVGLGPRSRKDLLLARDTCRAFQEIKQISNDQHKPPIKYENDHAMFREIVLLIEDFFTSTKDDGYISFVTDAINVIYHLANQPDALMQNVLLVIARKSNVLIEPRTENSNEPSQDNSSQLNVTTPHLLSRLLYIVGHVAIRQMVHLDNGVYKELKRRNALRDLKKKGTHSKTSNTMNASGVSVATPVHPTRRSVSTPASARQTLRNKEQANSTAHEDNGEEVLEGATADDTDAIYVDAALENDIVNGHGILAKFVPLVLDVCRYTDKYNDEQLQAWGVLALSKMMTVSSSFCVKHLQLLVTIMERSPHPGIRSNVLIGLSDLTTRFPNQVEPWTGHIYGRLRDENVQVRSTCVRMLSNLIMREMIRVKGQVSALALSIMDENEEIRVATKQFFKDLSNKGNSLYNVMPDILSRLTDPELNLEEDDFHEILKYILGLMQKERQIDTIIDKLCSRFILATSERQWRDLSYCLALLQFSGKSIRRLMESLPLLKDKIHHPLVLKSLRSVIEQTKKKAEAKAACIELEEKIEELLKTTEEPAEGVLDDREAMPPPPVPKPRKKTRRPRNRRSSSSEEDEDNNGNEDDSGSDSEDVPANARKTVAKRRGRIQDKNSRPATTDSNSDSDEEENAPKKTPRKNPRTPKNSTKRKKPVESAISTPTRSKRNRQCESPIAGTPSQTTPRRTSTRLTKSASKRH